MTNDELLPCGIPRNEHKICWERNCYLSGEGCPVHQGPKKHIIRRLPDYIYDTVLIDGARINIGAAGMRHGS
ncbi:MAG: hypothetical protein HQ591_10790 [candidate division Zixibacteria bacterium]|nr:hypothetical protein [Candidatus Tariuqbacter arcticus]